MNLELLVRAFGQRADPPDAHCPSTVAPSAARASHSLRVMQVPVRSLLALGVHESCLKLRMLKIPNSPDGKTAFRVTSFALLVLKSL